MIRKSSRVGSYETFVNVTFESFVVSLFPHPVKATADAPNTETANTADNTFVLKFFILITSL